MLWCCCDEVVTKARAYYGQWQPGNATPATGINHVVDYPDRNVSSTTDYLLFQKTPAGADSFNNGMVLVENVLIPQGATVSAASLTLTLLRQGVDNGGKIRCKVRAWDVDDCPRIPILGMDVWANGVEVDNAPRTTAITSQFLFFDFTANTAPGIYSVTTPDLAAIVNEIVARPGWQSGNSIMFFFEQSGSTSDVPPIFFNQLVIYISAGGAEDDPLGPNDSAFTFTL